MMDGLRPIVKLSAIILDINLMQVKRHNYINNEISSVMSSSSIRILTGDSC